MDGSVCHFLYVSGIERTLGCVAQLVVCHESGCDSQTAGRILNRSRNSINQVFDSLSRIQRSSSTINGERNHIYNPVVGKGLTLPNRYGICITCPRSGFIFIADNPSATHSIYLCHSRSKRSGGFDDNFRNIGAILIRKDITTIRLTVEGEVQSILMRRERTTVTNGDGHTFVCRTGSIGVNIRDTGITVPNNIHRC